MMKKYKMMYKISKVMVLEEIFGEFIQKELTVK